ncbi:HK97-gp10 family putative phage morphogenesis protein [Tranquillimonas alkanivorans]|uniref:Phage protein, HK97 gp10 family n=1 Tax=Tranquillimonas alkanivorans TaxID=441119 RepID=A0A1I5RWQ9_9RHOB|nr:HK97-gp10 family putative phage morphogenesis protein [Tranquillimonas alkanivorans]SFP62691.1 phage protein, HK97 gp10 family [Tranquillimonas alkanivorans]
MSRDGGLKNFQYRMSRIPKEVRKAVKPALMQSGYEIAETMEGLAPEVTGDLMGSIQVTAPGDSTPPYSQPGGSQVAGPNEVVITAGNTDVRYAHLVEYGTKNSTARPFFWPAFRMSKKRAENRIKRAISKAVKENWGTGK